MVPTNSSGNTTAPSKVVVVVVLEDVELEEVLEVLLVV